MDKCCEECKHSIITGGDMVPYGDTHVPLPDYIECDCPEMPESGIDKNLDEDGVNCPYFERRDV